jgi:hypothetical protein
MNAWIVYRQNRRPGSFVPETVITLRNGDLICHQCPGELYCRHIALVVGAMSGYDSPFIELFDAGCENEALQELDHLMLQRALDSLATPPDKTTHAFIELF